MHRTICLPMILLPFAVVYVLYKNISLGESANFTGNKRVNQQLENILFGMTYLRHSLGASVSFSKTRVVISWDISSSWPLNRHSLSTNKLTTENVHSTRRLFGKILHRFVRAGLNSAVLKPVKTQVNEISFNVRRFSLFLNAKVWNFLNALPPNALPPNRNSQRETKNWGRTIPARADDFSCTMHMNS